MITFPRPPASMLELGGPEFLGAPEVWEWAQAMFLDEASPFYNPEHDHLIDADILFVWSAKTFKSKGRMIAGTAQLWAQQGANGKKEFLEGMYRSLNGGNDADFIITLCTPYVVEASPASICALVEHEMYHCGQAKDEWGEPKFKRSGEPVFASRGHDLEEFMGVMRRYGAEARPEVAEIARYFESGPELNIGAIDRAVCGCGAVVGMV